MAGQMVRSCGNAGKAGARISSGGGPAAGFGPWERSHPVGRVSVPVIRREQSVVSAGSKQNPQSGCSDRRPVRPRHLTILLDLIRAGSGKW